MSNVPYSDLGESSGQQLKNPVSADFARRSSEEDKLTEAGDIGVSDKVFASYQKSGHKAAKGKNQLKLEHDEDHEDDIVNINSSLKTRHPTYMWLRHPKVRENWKTVAGAIFLLIVGILFLICGIVLATVPNHDGPKAIIFFICAVVCILPGGYHTIYIYRATKGWRGYTFESLPSFR
ncbi:transmembrane protein 134-like [Dendronephthya gigantea]|uniref:transmembrane protein 134-like n=1 Tax=Dendronephthya gigantea TaxID=151771 RepID=UPI00106B61ED|nr:transmembrane protein 134-like [Dendronephthya gigantea]